LGGAGGRVQPRRRRPRQDGGAARGRAVPSWVGAAGGAGRGVQPHVREWPQGGAVGARQDCAG
jgi:hypothetical protein